MPYFLFNGDGEEKGVFLVSYQPTEEQKKISFFVSKIREKLVTSGGQLVVNVNDNTHYYKYNHNDNIYYDVLLIKSDKNTIIADGIDKATITVESYDRFNAPKETTVTFNVDGQTQSVQTTNGVATTAISSSVSKEIVIQAIAKDFLPNEIKVVAE